MAEEVVSKAKENMEKSVRVFVEELSRMRTGRASTSLLEPIEIEYYGSMVPINTVATLSAPEPRLLTVKPFETQLIADIERAIQASGLGLTPANDGKLIRIPIPALTEERRKEIVKVMRKQSEDAKVAVRNVRRDANDSLKKMQKAGDISEDDLRKFEKQVQEVTDHEISRIEKIMADKEADVMKV